MKSARRPDPKTRDFLRKVDAGLRKAIEQVAEEHRLAGQPLVVSKNGKVALVPVEQVARVGEPSVRYTSRKKRPRSG